MKRIKLIWNSVSKGIFIGLWVVITLFSVYAWQSTTTNDSVDNNLKADTNDTLTLDKWNGLVQRVSGIETATNGDIKIWQLAGSSNRCVYADSNGILHVKWDDCGSAGASGDNLGNHTATQNIDLNWNKIVNGWDSGISVSSGGKVGIGTTTPHAKLHINWGTLEVSRLLWSTPSSNPDATVLASFRNWNKSPDTRVLDIGVNSDNSAYIRPIGTNLSIFGGNVGIGTKTPQARLHVTSSSKTNVIITDSGGHYKTNWPSGRSGGLATWDIVGASALFNNFDTNSDRRLKKEITPLDQEKINNLLKLNPVSFKWKDTKIDNEKHFGFIAQEVKPLFGNLVTTAGNEEKTMSVRYLEFIPVMVETIQQQQKQIEELKNEIEKLKNQ